MATRTTTSIARLKNKLKDPPRGLAASTLLSLAREVTRVEILHALGRHSSPKEATTAAALADALGIRTGVVSRALGLLVVEGAIKRKRSAESRDCYLYWARPDHARIEKDAMSTLRSRMKSLPEQNVPVEQEAATPQELAVAMTHTALVRHNQALADIADQKACQHILATQTAELEKTLLTLRTQTQASKKRLEDLQAAVRSERALAATEPSLATGTIAPRDESPVLDPQLDIGAAATAAARVLFIEKLRARPALEPLAQLAAIERDYRHALKRLRGSDF